MPAPILAHHLVLSSYGFWLANDPRGSGSKTLREEKWDFVLPYDGWPFAGTSSALT